MIHPSPYKDQTVAVLGLGKSGLAAVKSLMAAGARVWVWDDQEKAREGLTAMIEPTDLLDVDWSEVDLLVMSPGIPHTFPKAHPVADLARAHDCPIVCDVDLLLNTHPEAKYITITGTNGKSTTTALIHHLLDTCGFDVQVGGNFGIPVMALETPGPDSIIVLELSSYQLERTPSLISDIAIWLNISPDHLERHGSMAGYVAAKENIFNHQSSDHFALIGVDDEESRQVFENHQNDSASPIAFSAQNKLEKGIYIQEGWLYDAAFGNDPVALIDLKDIKTLPGQHNWQNACAAFGAVIAAGAHQEDVLKAMASFPGLAHRQEWVRRLENVTFINDSKATNADAAQKALTSYDDIFWICGGVAKEGGLDGLTDDLGTVRKAFLIGQAADSFAQTLCALLPTEICQTLEVAVTRAFEEARKEGLSAPTVLLSPACASFDQYPNFEVRGDHFRELVTTLNGEAA